jgi:tripartite-type tricarboxylate transporter receptor subunit TctC
MWNRLLRVAGVLTFALCGAAQAQSWPTGKTIQVVIPLTAGSATAIIARAISEQVDKQIGSTTIVESRIGGAGTVAAGAVAKAAPDGFTLLLTSAAHTITAVTYTNLAFDPIGDFAPVAAVATLPNVLVATPEKGWKSVQDLVTAAKAKPGVLNYATVGPASAAHFNVQRFRLSAGFEAQAVPFKGPIEGLTEVMAGRIDFHFVPLGPALPLIRDGKVLPLAVSGTRRAADLPDVPTTVEAGFANSEYLFWFGVMYPAKTPAAIVERLAAEIRKALEVPVVKERIARLGGEPAFMPAAEFGALLRKELDDNAKIVKATGLKIN